MGELGEEKESSESFSDDLFDEEDILAEELEGIKAETSDDEYRIAIEGVKGTCSKLIALTQ